MTLLDFVPESRRVGRSARKEVHVYGFWQNLNALKNWNIALGHMRQDILRFLDEKLVNDRNYWCNWAEAFLKPEYRRQDQQQVEQVAINQYIRLKKDLQRGRIEEVATWWMITLEEYFQEHREDLLQHRPNAILRPTSTEVVDSFISTLKPPA